MMIQEVIQKYTDIYGSSIISKEEKELKKKQLKDDINTPIKS